MRSLIPTLKHAHFTDLPFGRETFLRWLYVGRLTVVLGILVGALYQWLVATREQTFLATMMFLVALVVTVPSYWYTHLRGREPGAAFCYVHVITDTLLVTGIVHITGGQGSYFSPLYVLVISEGALLLPLAGGVLIAALASLLYFGDLFWFHAATLTGSVAYQIILFATVALATGFIGDRLRGAGLALGAVQSELRQLRLDTGDILASINTGVLSVDGVGRLAYLNPAGEALLGLDARQWHGAPVMSRVDEIAPGMGMLLKRSIEDGIPTSRFRTLAQRNGHEVVLGVSTTVLGRGPGQMRSATALFQDISDLEQVDALNRRTERLEAVAELSASLAHEIKNPLASIRSAVEQIAKPSLGRDDRTLLQRLVVTESERLSRLLTEFLEFSGLRIGKREVLDVRATARDCLALTRQHPARPEGVELELVQPDTPQWVHGDRDLLHRAFFNLVLNAMQFSGPAGKVTVKVETVHRGTGARARDWIRLTVRDTGPGVPPEDMPRIFDPFYTRRAGGSGLGLAVVHRAVAAHEGTVTVDQPDGGGAAFVVDLPAESTSGKAKEGA